MSKMGPVRREHDTRAVAQRKDLGPDKRLRHAHPGIVADHGVGKKCEEIDPQVSPGVAVQVRNDNAPPGDAGHLAKHAHRLVVVQVVKEHVRQRIVEGVVGKRQAHRVRAGDRKSRVAVGCRGFGHCPRMEINPDHSHVKPSPQSPS